MSCAVSASMAAEQRIEEDPLKWISYQVTYDEGFILYSAPPNDIYESVPTVLIPRFERELPFALVATLQYDYPRNRWGRLAKFEVTYHLVKVPEDVGPDTPIIEVAKSARKSWNASLGLTVMDDRTFSTEITDGTEWVRTVDPHDSFRESYIRRCGRNYLFWAVSNYADGKGKRHLEWRKRRQLLFRRMIERVTCVAR
jgi:hypothetical protein